MADIQKLEKELWEAADNLRANSKLTSQQYCMPVLGLIFLRYAWGRFKMVDEQIKAKRAQSIADMATRLLNDELTDEDVVMVFQSYLKSKGIDAEVSAVAVREGVERSKELENSLNELKDALGDLFGLNPVENFKYENINKNKKPEDPDDVIDSFLRKFGLR